VGSNSNVAENDMAEEQGRAAVWEINQASGAKGLFATGLRNPNGMAWTADGRLWTVVNERDELGSDLVHDYLTSVKDGGFYGWPYSWYGADLDLRVQPQRPDLVATAVVPDYALGAHVAPLGLAAASEGPLLAAARAQRDGQCTWRHQRHVHRPARLVEPRAQVGLQGGVRWVRWRPTDR